MLGIVLSWLACIELEPRVGQKPQQTLPSFVRLRLCSFSAGQAGKGSLERNTERAFTGLSISVVSLCDCEGLRDGEHLYSGVTNIWTYPRLPHCASHSCLTFPQSWAQEEWVWSRKRGFIVWGLPALLGLSAELKIKPQAESDTSAATARISLMVPTTHLEEKGFLFVACGILSA